MKTIKIELNGVTSYRKPSRKLDSTPGQPFTSYKPDKKYDNMWHFSNKVNLCKQIWELGHDYSRRMDPDNKNKPRRRVRGPALVRKALYALYCTGMRQQELFIKPYPTFNIHSVGKKVVVRITHVNEKHRGKTITAVIPVFCEWEQRMWDYVTDGGTVTKAEQIFKYEEWKSTHKSYISHVFKNNFRTSLTDSNGEIHKDHGINPHILRHMRSYNVLVNHGLWENKLLVQKWFGWNDDKMLNYYPHIHETMEEMDQERLIEEGRFAARIPDDLKIDANKRLLNGPTIH